MLQFPLSAAESLAQCRRRGLAHKPFLTTDTVMTWGQLDDKIRRLAGFYKELNLEPGDRIVYSTEDETLAAVLFLSLFCCGLTAVMLDPETKLPRASSIVDAVKPKIILLDDTLVESWSSGREQSTESSWHIIPLSKNRSRSIIGTLLQKERTDLSFEARLKRTIPIDPPAELDPESDAYILFTSGTTSRQKGVCITRRALEAHIRTLSEVYEMNPQSRILNNLILSHTDGIIEGPVLSFYTKASLYRPPRFRTQTIVDTLDTMIREKITHYFASPTMLSLILRFAPHLKDSFRNGVFRFVISSGAILEANLWTQFEEFFGVRIMNVYGLTETVTGGIFAGPDDSSRQIGTIGKPVDCDACIIDESGTQLPDGELGELLIRGELIMRGYLNDPEETRRVLREGWFHTGDIAFRRSDGCYCIKGRKKSVIIVGGINVHPEEVTESLTANPAVADACTLGMPDPDWGEHVVSVVVVKESESVTEKELVTHCRRVLEEVKVPSRIIFLSSIPRSHSGKVQLQEVRKMISSNPESDSACTSSSDNDVHNRILEIAAEVFKMERCDLSPETSEQDSGEWDSLSHLALIGRVEQAFSLRFSVAEIIGIRTLGELISCCRAKLNENCVK